MGLLFYCVIRFQRSAGLEEESPTPSVTRRPSPTPRTFGGSPTTIYPLAQLKHGPALLQKKGNSAAAVSCEYFYHLFTRNRYHIHHTYLFCSGYAPEGVFLPCKMASVFTTASRAWSVPLNSPTHSPLTQGSTTGPTTCSQRRSSLSRLEKATHSQTLLTLAANGTLIEYTLLPKVNSGMVNWLLFFVSRNGIFCMSAVQSFRC